MGNKKEVNGKILFGVDFLCIALLMAASGLTEPNDHISPITISAAKLFLLQWGFTTEEIEQADQIFTEKVNNNGLDGTLNQVIDRVVNFIRDDKEKQERFVIELAALALMDLEVTEREDRFVGKFKDLFDMKPSEFQNLIEIGGHWAIALNYFGDEFMKEKNGSK